MNRNRVPPIQILRIFVRNRRLGGWSDTKIAAAIRKRLKWDSIEPGTLSAMDTYRYVEVVALLSELESPATE